jgi:hypothetical protein
MHIEITFMMLTLLSLAVTAGALLYSALQCDLTGADLDASACREARPFVLARAPAVYRLGTPEAPIPVVRLPSRPAIKVIRLRLDGAQDEAYLLAK